MMVHEIDRQTPFAAEQVSFEPRVIARDPATRQLRGELVVLPLSRLQALLERLGPLAAGLAGVDVIASDGSALGVNLLPAAQRMQRGGRGRLLHLGLVAAVLAIVFASLWITLGNRESAHEAWTGRVQQAQREAREARKLRSALQDSVRAANFLAKQRATQPTVLEIIADLTHRLPDDTWLEKIQVNSGNVTLIGVSGHATALVGVLQDSSLIHRPTLTGSVQADPRTGKERFTLTAVIAGSEAEKEGANGAASGN